MALGNRSQVTNQALLAAALAGLLSTAQACGSSDSDTADGASQTGASSSSVAGCETGVVSNPSVTSSTKVAMTQEEFAATCASRNGTVQVHPHCGGANSCRGMSYDSGTEALTEHSCRASNTCTGFSCIICS
jgi:hypothetical protein